MRIISRMNRVKPTKNQGSIDVLFAKKKPEKEVKQQIQTLMSENSEVQEFYNSLNKAEQVAHEIASEKLGTSYDVQRTHGFIKWKKEKAKITTTRKR